MLGIDDPRHRLERAKVLDLPRAIAGLLFQFPGRRIHRFLIRIHQAAGQLPPPAIGHKPVTPQHQHLVAIIQQDHDRRAVQPDHVMPVQFATRQLNVNLPVPHPRVVVYGPLPKRPPTPRFITLCASHALDSNACRKCVKPLQMTTFR